MVSVLGGTPAMQRGVTGHDRTVRADMVRVGGSRMRAVLVLPDVTCMRCRWCFFFDYHQKQP
jgi:hypothetical protein